MIQKPLNMTLLSPRFKSPSKSFRELAEKQKHIYTLIDDLFWDYDRLSDSGRKTLNKLANLLDMNEENTDI